MTPHDMLNLPMPQPNDAKAQTIKEYLHKLLLAVWIEEESFSGKRPFGNSGWQGDLAEALLQGEALTGNTEEDDQEYNEEVFQRLMRQCIDAVFSA